MSKCMQIKTIKGICELEIKLLYCYVSFHRSMALPKKNFHIKSLSHKANEEIRDLIFNYVHHDF